MELTEDGSIIYSIPEKISEKLDEEFCRLFVKELHMINGFSLEEFNYDSVAYIEGTGGWYEALATTCRLTNKPEVLIYYNSRPWYDSDCFDSCLCDLIEKYKLILPGDEIAEFARQNGIPEDDIGYCNECYSYFNKKDLEATDDEEYICKACNGHGEAHSLDINREKAINDILGINNNEYFICENCGKIHYNFNKGNKYCLYCEIQNESENPNANNHYRESIDLNKKFLYTYTKKTLKYDIWEAEVSYIPEDDIFVGRITKKDGSVFRDSITFYNKNINEMEKELKRAVENYERKEQA